MLFLPPWLLWEGFQQDFGTWLQEFAPIHQRKHEWGWALMLGDESRLPGDNPIHPEGAEWGWSQDSV